MTMPNEVIAPIVGLNSNRNEISTPPGSCTDALNVIFTKPGVAERRRGFGVSDITGTLGNGSGRSNSLVGTPVQMLETDKGDLLLHKGAHLYADMGATTMDWGNVYFADGFSARIVALCLRNDTDRYVYFYANSAFWVLDQTTARITLLAGLPGTSGTTNATGIAARIGAGVEGMCFNTANTVIYFCDTTDHTVRSLTISTGVVAAVAGLSATTGTTDNTGTLARFNTPTGIVAINASNFLVCDRVNNTIRNVTTGGVVTTPYGAAGVSANTDANGTSSRFGTPYGICFDGTNAYVTTQGFSNVRQIVISTTAVTTIQTGLNVPSGIAVAGGNIVVCTKDGLGGFPSTLTGLPVAIAGVGSTADAQLLRSEFYVSGWSNTGGTSSTHALYRFSRSGSTTLRPAVIMGGVDGQFHPRTAMVANGLMIAPDSAPSWSLGGPTMTGSQIGTRIRSADVSRSTYVTSSNGVKKIDRVFAEVATTTIGANISRMAGVPRALAPTLTLSASTPTLLVANAQRAYRVVWARRDANNYLQSGAPCERVLISNNAGATRDVSMSIPIPHGITANDFYQVYATTIALSLAEPGDDCALVREGFPTDAEISAGSITYVDLTPDVLRGADLYTNSNQEGIENANDVPPLARDLCEYRGHLLYSDFTDRHRLFLQMIGVTTFVAGTTKITIGGVVFNCEAAETIASGNFQLYTAGTASQNIANTSQSLCRVINGYRANNDFYAWYESAYDGAPGTILIEERVVGGAGFSVTANNAAAGNGFSPPLPPGAGAPATLGSIADRGKSRIRVSKSGEPEACPLYRDVTVGSEDDQLLRVIALRDSVVVIKERSIWRIVGGTFEDFVAARIDDTVRCVSRDSAAKLDNSVVFLSNQGFVVVTEGSVVNISEPERYRHLLLARIAAENPYAITAVANERQRVYLCTTPQIEPDRSVLDYDISNTTIMCWNVDGQAWSRWALACDPVGNYGVNVSSLGSRNDLLFMGVASGRQAVLRQYPQSAEASAEYADCEIAVSLTYGAFRDGRQAVVIANRTAADFPALGSQAGNVLCWGHCVRFAPSLDTVLTLAEDRTRYITSGANGLSAAVGAPGATESEGAKLPIPVIVGVVSTLGNPGELKQQTEMIVTVAESNMHDLHMEAVSSQDYRYTPTSYSYANSAVDSYVSSASPQNDLVVALANNFFVDDDNGEEGADGRFYELRTLRFFVQKEKQTGDWIGIRLYQSNALCRFELKGITLGLRSLSSNRVRQ